MPLVSFQGQLQTAQAERYGVPCFDTYEQLGTQGIFEALEAKRAPAIIGLYTQLMDEAHGRAFTAFVRAMAEDASVPVSIILDHGASFEHCVRALRWGFTDVMYDGSKLPLEDNIANTRLVVQAAHAAGAAVEAELGHVGSGSEYRLFGGQGKGMTDPATVARFVAETGVDVLAVSIGTAHGLYDGEPTLALDLLADIREQVDIPLVLHGGSGLSDDQFHAAIAGGISKVNIFTNLAVAAADGVVANLAAGNRSMRGVTTPIQAAFRAECQRLLDVFGASGRA